MRARFRALRDDGIHARALQLAGFFDRRGGSKDNDAARFETRRSRRDRDAEGEAEDGRTRVEHRFELRGERIGRRLRG